MTGCNNASGVRGLCPYTIWKGVGFVETWSEVMMANSTAGICLPIRCAVINTVAWIVTSAPQSNFLFWLTHRFEDDNP